MSISKIEDNSLPVFTIQSSKNKSRAASISIKKLESNTAYFSEKNTQTFNKKGIINRIFAIIHYKFNKSQYVNIKSPDAPKAIKIKLEDLRSYLNELMDDQSKLQKEDLKKAFFKGDISKIQEAVKCRELYDGIMQHYLKDKEGKLISKSGDKHLPLTEDTVRRVCRSFTLSPVSDVEIGDVRHLKGTNDKGDIQVVRYVDLAKGGFQTAVEIFDVTISQSQVLKVPNQLVEPSTRIRDA